MSVLLIGNFGVGNLGDDILRDYFLQRFPDISWTVVSARPSNEREVPRLPLGLRSLLRPWWRTLSAFRSCDAVVFGGGSLFTDTESVKACLLWGWHAWMARVFRKPIILAFQGIGPFRTKMGEGIAKRVVGWASFLSVRDGASFTRVRSWVDTKKIVQTMDPAILLMDAEKMATQPKNVFTIIPRGNVGETFFARASELVQSGGYKGVHILSLHPESDPERAICRRLEELFPSHMSLCIYSLEELLEHVRRSAFIFTARFHGGIAALALGVPFEAFSLGAGDKLSQLGGERGELRRLAAVGEEALRVALGDLGKAR